MLKHKYCRPSITPEPSLRSNLTSSPAHSFKGSTSSLASSTDGLGMRRKKKKAPLPPTSNIAATLDIKSTENDEINKVEDLIYFSFSSVHLWLLLLSINIYSTFHLNLMKSNFILFVFYLDSYNNSKKETTSTHTTSYIINSISNYK